MSWRMKYFLNLASGTYNCKNHFASLFGNHDSDDYRSSGVKAESIQTAELGGGGTHKLEVFIPFVADHPYYITSTRENAEMHRSHSQLCLYSGGKLFLDIEEYRDRR